MGSSLQSQDTKIKGMVKQVVTDVHYRLEQNMKSFKFDVLEFQTVAIERYTLNEKSLSDVKASTELKVQKIHDLITSKVKKIYVEDIRDFNVDYKTKLEKNVDKDGEVFKDIETSLNTFQEHISKLTANSTSLMFDANNAKDVLEACFKSHIAPILDLVFRLPTNSPRAMQVSQAGERGGSSKMGGEDKGKVVGKVFSHHIQTLILAKLVCMMATIVAPNVKVDMTKLQ
ncbi:unnamed protein product [Lactuca saligna]|uniref:Uncharacterized protein n=1 Tax=Lactuca saligna TaxID=75948 RepID=A0AA35YDE4_LACSI|nr:unnamed protein product [Lactuca saligna]